ncbi:hypothetical protein [Streptomyces sp. NPDC087294]|uniref:hypothetical protein n=1 Tax=Streptomyces sp. NPDC087294 TaxID=3365777 RepID=UPI003804533D
MPTSLTRLHLRLAGRRAALVGLLLMLFVIPGISGAQAAGHHTLRAAPAAPTAPDPCEQLDKDSAAYKYCKEDGGNGGSSTPSPSASPSEDPCADIKGRAKEYCERGQGGASPESPFNSCASAPDLEAPGAGVLGWIDSGPAKAPAARNPQAANADAYIYEQYGYAGLRWNTYNLGCNSLSGALENAASSTDSWFANKVFTWSKAWTALAVVLRMYATDSSLFDSLDPAIEQATQAVRTAVFSPWIGTSLILLGTAIIYQARKRNLPDVMGQIAWALLVMTAATGVANYPVEAAKFADTAINTTVSAIDQAFAATNSAPSQPDTTPPASDSAQTTSSIAPVSYSAAVPAAVSDRAQGNTAHGNMLVNNVLYSAWLRGELGDDDSLVARKYGMRLFDSQALTWRENRLPAEERTKVIETKQEAFKEIAGRIEKEDPTAYAHLSGRESGRLGAATISNFQAAVSNSFSLVADLVIVVGKWMLRLIVILFPALAVIGLHRRTSNIVKTAFQGVMAAVINIPVFAAGGSVDVLLVREISDPSLGIPSWLKVIMLGAITYVLWKMLRPLTRLTAMVSPNHNYLEDGGRALTGPARLVKGYAKYYLGARYFKKLLAAQRGSQAADDEAEEDSDDEPDSGPRPYTSRGQHRTRVDDWWNNGGTRGAAPASASASSSGGGNSSDPYASYEPDDDHDGGAAPGPSRNSFVPGGSAPTGGDDVWDSDGWFVDDLGPTRRARPLSAASTGAHRSRGADAGSLPPAPPAPSRPGPVTGGGSAAALPPGADVPGPRQAATGAPSAGPSPAPPVPPIPDAVAPVVGDSDRPQPVTDSSEPRVVPPQHIDGGTVYVLFDPDAGYTLRDERTSDQDGGEL